MSRKNFEKTIHRDGIDLKSARKNESEMAVAQTGTKKKVPIQTPSTKKTGLKLVLKSRH